MENGKIENRRLLQEMGEIPYVSNGDITQDRNVTGISMYRDKTHYKAKADELRVCL